MLRTRLPEALTATLVAALVLPCIVTRPALAHTTNQDTIAPGPMRIRVIASAPRLNRRVMGPVTSSIRGVPAEPVNSFCWDGNGSVPIEGHVQLVVDPVAEIGIVEASWTDEHGDWTYRQTQFVHPEHWSGARFGASINDAAFIYNEGIAINAYLHGDTGAGMPVMPTVFAYVAAWGPAEVTLDGEPFDNPYEIPAPKWLGHLMVTEGVRHPDGTVRTVSGGIYDPSQGAFGAVEPEGDLEMHVVWHDERFPMTENVPPIFSFFYHLVFEDVSIELVQANDPIVIDPDAPPAPEIGPYVKPGLDRRR